MRRSVSIAVLAILLFGFFVPLAQGSSQSVPACCRAGGAHHCMGMAGMDGFHSEASRCPYRTAPAVTSGIVALVTGTQQAAIAAAESAPNVPLSSAPHFTRFDAVQKRGPPHS